MKNVLQWEADLAEVDQEILRLARENERHDPAVSLHDAILKVMADRSGLVRRKRALEDAIAIGRIPFRRVAIGRIPLRPFSRQPAGYKKTAAHQLAEAKHKGTGMDLVADEDLGLRPDLSTTEPRVGK